MLNCVENGKRLEQERLAEIAARRCNARELQSSHGGGNDYSPACKLSLGNNGRHRGKHVAENGYSWEQGQDDRWL